MRAAYSEGLAADISSQADGPQHPAPTPRQIDAAPKYAASAHDETTIRQAASLDDMLPFRKFFWRCPPAATVQHLSTRRIDDLLRAMASDSEVRVSNVYMCIFTCLIYLFSSLISIIAACNGSRKQTRSRCIR